MLVKLLPEQVEEAWEQFGGMIQQSLPPTAARTLRGMVNVLRSVLMEDMVLWGYYHEEELYGIVATSIEMDQHTGTKQLLIYAIYGIRQLKMEFWQDGLGTLKEYARSNDCKRIIAYSNTQNIISIFQKLGGNADYTYLTMEV